MIVSCNGQEHMVEKRGGCGIRLPTSVTWRLACVSGPVCPASPRAGVTLCHNYTRVPFFHP